MKPLEKREDFQNLKPQIVVTLGHLINRGVNTRPELAKKAGEIYTQKTVYKYLKNMEKMGLVTTYAEGENVAYNFHPHTASDRYNLPEALERLKDEMEQNDDIDPREIDDLLEEIIEHNQQLVSQMRKLERDWNLLEEKLKELGINEDIDGQKVYELFKWIEEKQKKEDRFHQIRLPKEAMEESKSVDGAVPSLLKEFINIYTDLYAGQPSNQIAIDFLITAPNGIPRYQKVVEEPKDDADHI